MPFFDEVMPVCWMASLILFTTLCRKLVVFHELSSAISQDFAFFSLKLHHDDFHERAKLGNFTLTSHPVQHRVAVLL
uniref:Putative secreted protein n=2 Tax=Anopheles triannulatus TaxID=58253 RepID=A0A2M4B5C4_9DIPT